MIFKTHIVEQTIVADGTREVICARPDGFNYTAGQYVQISVSKLDYTDPKGASRVFSLTSNPHDTRYISVLFRDTGSGFKKTLVSLALGDEVIIEGPMGHFVYPEGITHPQIYIAGGVGIAPFLSMLAHNATKENPTAITLLYANRNPDMSAHRETLQNLSVEKQWFTIEEIYGKIETDIIKQYHSECPKAAWFIVGPPPMVTEVQSLLHQVGVSDSAIRIESFTGY